MTKKGIAIFIVIILILGALSFGGYKVVADITSKKKAQQELMIKYDAMSGYWRQYGAFYDITYEEYKPYNKSYEYILQTRIIYYIKKTGKTITLGDVETFLATQYNPDGTPRTWKDDETGIIKDYVDWCAKNADELNRYRADLEEIIAKYDEQEYKQGRDCPYSQLSKLSPEQIIEVDKKYEDPNYELVLK